VNLQSRTEAGPSRSDMHHGRKLFKAWAPLGRLVRRNPAAAVSGIVILVILLAAISAPWLAPYDPYQPRVGPRLHAPSFKYFLGTDSLGRDMLSRIIIGSQVAILVGTTSIALGVGIGTLIGLVSGWAEGLVDQISQRFIDAMMAIPGLVLAMALASVLTSSFWRCRSLPYRWQHVRLEEVCYQPRHKLMSKRPARSDPLPDG
jgi:ABC-type dipeptide/oligopeptide/nickel transport system permease subunit